jgi:hypothetical protein
METAQARRPVMSVYYPNHRQRSTQRISQNFPARYSTVVASTTTDLSITSKLDPLLRFLGCTCEETWHCQWALLSSNMDTPEANRSAQE